MIDPVSVLVLCTGNSCRSQIAEGYLRELCKDKITVRSAGVETHGLNQRAVQVMAEDGIDISSHTSNHINEFMDMDFDYVVTVCDHAKEACPYFPSQVGQIHKNFPDPARATGSEEEIMAEFRNTRDQIKSYSKEFLDKYINQSA